MDRMSAPCECEHIDHFDGGPCHEYGHECDLEDMTQVETPCGRFTVCVLCRRDHLTDDLLSNA